MDFITPYFKRIDIDGQLISGILDNDIINRYVIKYNTSENLVVHEFNFIDVFINIQEIFLGFISTGEFKQQNFFISDKGILSMDSSKFI